MRTIRIFLSLAVAALLLVTVTPGVAQGPYYAVGSVSMEVTSVGVGVGFSTGSGVLRFRGQLYNFRVNGLSVGNVGVASVMAMGNVYNMTDISQFPGNYAAAGAGIALVNGRAGLTMQNQKGTIINLYALQQGLELNVGPQGFSIVMQ